MRIYNTLSGEKELLKKSFFRSLKLFVCGPTVYDYSHIGHARTYLAFDAIVRYLRSQGFKVFYLQNITDVDDKIIARAKEKNKKPKEIANFFENAYYADMKAIGASAVNRYAKASDFIGEIVKQVQTLLKKGYAYKIEGDGYYFDISKFNDYGKLSKRTATQAEDAVSRIDENIKKRNRGDFALWKFYDGDPSWDTKLGRGRPGWHIEDTSITEKFFGPQYDIHGGALDLKFPHHEAEIAQQEAASGRVPFVKIWMHTGFLLIDGQKMSKSLENFITINQFLEKHHPEILRWIVLNHHYRSPVNYTDDLVIQMEESLKTIKDFLEKIDFVAQLSKQKTFNDSEIKKAEAEFQKAMEDDFNTPAALSKIFNLINFYQENIWQISPKEAKTTKKFIENSLKTLGLTLKTKKIPSKIQKLAGERELLRVNKQFVQSDVLRKKIIELGYKVEDTPLGPFVSKV